MFALRFPLKEIRTWASRYDVAMDRTVEEEIGPRFRNRRYLTREDFLELCRWKTKRSQPLCIRNSDEDVSEASRVALQTTSERVRIGVLLALDGVSWPTASVILHFGILDRYPILDVRALWSLGMDPLPNYTLDLWLAYAEHCRELARAANVDMRTLDRGLWQYSAENQH